MLHCHSGFFSHKAKYNDRKKAFLVTLLWLTIVFGFSFPLYHFLPCRKKVWKILDSDKKRREIKWENKRDVVVMQQKERRTQKCSYTNIVPSKSSPRLLWCKLFCAFPKPLQARCWYDSMLSVSCVPFPLWVSWVLMFLVTPNHLRHVQGLYLVEKLFWFSLSQSRFPYGGTSTW